ncbi:ComEC/Rec2 family competence protein [Flavobacterium luminosum]|uniref:Competence protein ComEC family protein n=1 Tax=Flavobacterium luminosum TaxID=2949086 RepID=A0ABT0TPN4_9FLAO|nr:ComEC/Rec2 family competence protein [Flavobacterium sp. HXWNR70]MCL9809325.1 competence protein ComEC family protein [Flavobacterium sp. HXWNR70]
MKILQFPIVRVTFWFVLGILFSYYLTIPFTIDLVILLVAISLFSFVFITNHRKLKNNQWFSIALYFLFFSFGIHSIIIHKDNLKQNHYTQNPRNLERTTTIEATVIDKLKNTEKYNRYVIEIAQIEGQISRGKAILNIRKQPQQKDLITGNIIRIEDQLVSNFKPNNPNQFNYGHYLETKGIYAQIFTESSQIKVSNRISKDIWYYTSQFRNTIVENLAHSGFKKDELAIVLALILGQQQDISSEILKDYQFAGAIHILSVSGLHVGFIMLFVTLLLKPLPNTKTGNTTRIILILLSLWLFALIAGLSPSVVRSATMFSFLAIGNFINRATNPFHTIIASMFLILLFNPFFLFDIGFKLSYLAVFFILWLQPALSRIWHPKNSIIKYFWDIITVSFAAQIGTLPLSIYYFHQFPGLFFITNIVLIPTLVGIMSLGTVVVLLAFFNFTPELLTKPLELAITYMNQFIHWVASIENFIWTEIPLNFSLMILGYAIIISGTIVCRKPSFKKIVWLLSNIIAFQIVYLSTVWSSRTNSEFIVFNALQKTMIAQKTGNTIRLLSRDTIVKNSFEDKLIQTYATANFCSTIIKEPLNNCMYFENKKILVIDESAIFQPLEKADIIILSHAPKINLERLLQSQQPEMIIADASNYKSSILTWKATCVKNKIPFHSTYEKGFYKF